MQNNTWSASIMLIKNGKFLQKSVILLFFLIFGLAASPVFAKMSPAGMWRTYDDKTHKARSFVQIIEKKGVFFGRITRIFFRKGEGPNDVCDKCKDPQFRNKKIIGLWILWGVKKQGSSFWGKILDPESGKIYRVKMTLNETGKVMYVRGYIGLSLFGRTQRWYRVRVLPKRDEDDTE